MKSSIFYKVFFILVPIFLFLPNFTYGQSDLIEIAPPNAMIIFDSSSSMNQDEKGNVVNSGNAKGEDGVVRNYEGGGNHPDSKLYQAKQKVKEVIKDLEDINLGFATYGQAKTELRRGYYVRGRQNWTPGTPATPDQWRWTKKYWRFRNYSHTFTATSRTLDKGIGDTYVEKNHTFDDSPFNNGKSVPPPHGGTYKADLTYRITNITLDAEANVYTYTYTSDPHDHYEETTIERYFANNSPIDCDSVFPRPSGTWNTYDEASVPSPAWKCNGPIKIPGSAGSPGFFGSKYEEYSWNTLDNSIPGYPACPITYGSDNNWNPVGDPLIQANAWTKWTLVDPKDPKIPPSGQYVKITGINCYDASTYSYPADGSASKPHTWSYYKDASGNWSVKPNPYYPSSDGGGMINNNPGTFNNHYFFINIPKVDDMNNGYANRKAIVDLLDLNPVMSPETGRYHTKLPLKALDPEPKRRNSITSSADIPVKQTPLYSTLKDAYAYFDSYIKQDTLSAAHCRGNAVILITDGLESCEYIDPLHPNFGAAASMAEQMKKNLTVKTFVIGFGKEAGANQSSLNDIALKGGTEKAWFAPTKEDLQKALQNIFEIIKADKVARSTPVVTRNRSRLYRGFFNYKGFAGHLLAYELTGSGAIKGEVQWNGGASSGKGGDAGWVMKNYGRGKVYTWTDNTVNPTRVEFDDKKVNVDKLDPFVNPSKEDINGNGKVDWKDAKTIIKFVLDANYNDSTDEGIHGAGHHKGKRDANWLLGDIYHSTPLVVADPPLIIPDAAFPEKYSGFKTTWKNREPMIYVGANDGMLHAFSDIDGKEKFSIIPKNLLGKLKELGKTHEFYVDSSPKAHDVFFGGAWRTVLISGERGGGTYYFAVDVTDPDDPKILWEWTDPDGRLGFTWSRPEIGWVRINGQEKFVAFVGGGYSSTDNVGNTFYVVDIETGSKLKSFDVGDSKNKIPAGATAFDSDLDGRVNGVYFGDIQGVLWKIKIDKEEDINKWQLVKLYEPISKNPVFYPPAVTKNNQGKIMVYYGQGDELNLFEQTSSNSFFEVWDKGDSGQMIWEERLQKGEKVLAAPTVANNIVYFTTWLYTGTSDDCGAGKGRLYGLTTTSLGVAGDIGALVLDPLTGTPWGSKRKYFDITDYFPESKGIPSAPIVTNGMIFISTSLNAGQVITIRIPGWGTGRLKYWREVF